MLNRSRAWLIALQKSLARARVDRCCAKGMDREQFIGATWETRGELDLPIETFSRSFWLFDDEGHVGGSVELQEALEASLGWVGLGQPSWLVQADLCMFEQGETGPSGFMGHTCQTVRL